MIVGKSVDLKIAIQVGGCGIFSCVVCRICKHGDFVLFLSTGNIMVSLGITNNNKHCTHGKFNLTSKDGESSQPKTLAIIIECCLSVAFFGNDGGWPRAKYRAAFSRNIMR